MSEIITAVCPNCSAQLKVKGLESIGKKARCPKCKEPFVVKAPQKKPVPARAAVDDEDNFMALLNTAVKDSVRREAIPREPEELAAAQKRLTTQWGANVRRLEDVEDDDDGGLMAGLGVFGWILGGFIGGGFGACIWGAIGYATGMESGWIAWGVGFLAGAGVRLGAGHKSYGMGPGITAVLIAIASIMGGKLLVAYCLVEQFSKDMNSVASPEAAAISKVEEEVEEEFQKTGRVFAHEEVEIEAKKRWDRMPDDKKQAARDAAKAEGDAAGVDFEMGAAKAIGTGVVFVILMLSPWNILWFILAGGTAFKAGSGFDSD